jgi:hypothetical protein
MQIPPVSAPKQNGAGSDLVLNDCLAYLRFGRYWPFCDVARCPLFGRYPGKADERLTGQNQRS